MRVLIQAPPGSVRSASQPGIRSARARNDESLCMTCSMPITRYDSARSSCTSPQRKHQSPSGRVTNATGAVPSKTCMQTYALACESNGDCGVFIGRTVERYKALVDDLGDVARRDSVRA